MESIRNDFVRPTVHARNLFHLSATMYDAFAVYDDEAKLCVVEYIGGDSKVVRLLKLKNSRALLVAMNDDFLQLV